MATLRVVPDVVWAVAVKAKAPPTTSDVSTAGGKLLLPGKKGVPAFEPPHPAKLHRERIATAKRRPPERNLPMHPLCLAPQSCPQRMRTSCQMNWKTCSVEAGAGISKRRGSRLDRASNRWERLTVSVPGPTSGGDA